MLKSDEARIKKIIDTWEKLKTQMQARKITREALLTDEFSQWAVTTPLYNIGEQVYKISASFKEKIPIFRGAWSPVCVTDWCTTMTASTGRSLWKLYLMRWRRLPAH